MTQYTLRLSFDLRQVTQTLAYKFILKDNSKYKPEGDGPLAGTFNFTLGDEICVQAVATAPKDHVLNDDNFIITDCTFVSIPAHMTEFLSLFDKTSACSRINNENWNPVEPLEASAADIEKGILRYSRINEKLFKVVTKDGQWKISGYLSVQLPPLGDVPILDGLRNQLFYFDPEGSSGNGGGFGP